MATAMENVDSELQKSVISSLICKKLKKGDTWYLIDSKWYKQWKKYVGFDSWDTSHAGDESSHPGPVDNSFLLQFEGEQRKLKINLIVELDYMLVPEEAWLMFKSWFGISAADMVIARKVIEKGMFVKHCNVEVYLMELKLCTRSNQENYVVYEFSREDTIKTVEQTMRKVFAISEEKYVRLWNKYISNTFEPLNKADNTIMESGLHQGQAIIVEVQNPDGSWISPLHKPIQPSSSMETKSSGVKLKSSISEKPDHQSLEIITCVICFEIMTKPHIFPCHHSFCKACIDKLNQIKKGPKKGVECPTCRKFAINNDIESSFVINKLLDQYRQVKVNKTVGERCTKHTDYSVEGWCVPCNLAICAKCKFGGDHDVHPSLPLEDAFQKFLPKVNEKLGKVSKQISDLETEIAALNQRKKQMNVNKKQIKDEVMQNVTKICEDIDSIFNKAEKQINLKISCLNGDKNKKLQLVNDTKSLLTGSSGVKASAVTMMEKKHTELEKQCNADVQLQGGSIELPQVSLGSPKCDCKFCIGHLVTKFIES